MLVLGELEEETLMTTKSATNSASGVKRPVVRAPLLTSEDAVMRIREWWCTDEGREFAWLISYLEMTRGADTAFLFYLSVSPLSDLTRGRWAGRSLTVRSTAAFERKLGFRFSVEVDPDELRTVLDDLLMVMPWD